MKLENEFFSQKSTSRLSGPKSQQNKIYMRNETNIKLRTFPYNVVNLQVLFVFGQVAFYAHACASA
jgi:hypothetical protein